MKKQTVILTDDHQLFRQGLRLLLSGSGMVGHIMEAENGADCLALLATHKADLIFMDIEMPVMDGIEATHKISELYPEVNIIALSMYSDEGYYMRMIDAGAKGFMLKDSGFDEVEKAISEVSEGRNYFSAGILASIVKSISQKRAHKQNYDLTEREAEVLGLICQGLSNQEIADRLYISKRTVDKHRENLLLKSGCKNTASLVIYAIRNRFIEV